MTSFHVIRESESARDLRRRKEQAEHHARYSNLRDTFHPTFPASAIEYIKRHSSPQNTQLSYDADNTSDLVKLPPELIDLIFSKLSPAALVATRNTCRAWWTMIMGNAWILGSVLGFEHPPAVKVDQPNESNEAFLRLLQKELDHQSALYPEYMPPDIWPLRFRRRVMNFAIPQVCRHEHQKYSTSRSRFVSADFTNSGRFIVFLVTNSAVIAETSQQTHNMVFYQIAFSGEPLYVGTLRCSYSNGPLSIVGVIETQPNKSWSLTIDIEGNLRLYSVVTRKAYAKTDVPFVLEVQKTEIASFKVAKETNLVYEPLEYFPKPNKSWQILTCIHYDAGEVNGYIQKIALAKHVPSGTLWVAKLKLSLETPSPADDSRQFKVLQCHDDAEDEVITAIALIVAPKTHSIYRNVAVAYHMGSIRFAIIWQEDTRDHQYTELYFHDLPFRILYSTKEKGTAEQRNAYLQRLTEPESPSLLGKLEPSGLFVNLYGRRIQSLGWQMGGIHISSPLWDLPTAKTPRDSLKVQQEFGGLQIIESTIGQRDEAADNRKCFVWGPSGSDKHNLSLVVFDYRFQGVPKILTYGIRDGDSVWQSNLVNPPEYYFRHCACAVHDDGYDIVLPDTACAALIEMTNPSQKAHLRNIALTEQSTETLPSYPHCGTEEYNRKKNHLRQCAHTLFPLSGRLPPNPLNFLTSLLPEFTEPSLLSPTPAPTSITHTDPPARKAALERIDEELREHIREWKREGKSEFEIAQGWLHSRWSGWGGVRKPKGWREL